MDVQRARRVSPIRYSGLVLAGSLLLASCHSAPEADKAETIVKTTAPAGAPSASTVPFSPVDACTLITKADVETLAGKKVLDPVKEEISQLVNCSFGDPTAPQVGGRALSQVLTLSVMTGKEDAYYAGAVAQAKDILAMARKNAAKAESVSGFGDDAYWDSVFHKLSVVKAKYLVEVDVESDGDSLKRASAAMTKALERLPRE